MVLHGTKISGGSTLSFPTKIEGIVQFVLFLAHHNSSQFLLFTLAYIGISLAMTRHGWPIELEANQTFQ
jgi:hypothetical protein